MTTTSSTFGRRRRQDTRQARATRMAHAAKLMDAVMTGRKGRIRMPKVLGEHRLTTQQIQDVATKVRLRHIPGKGLGLVARKRLGAHVRIGVYGGRVYSSREHQRLMGDGFTTGKYAIDYYRRAKNGSIRDAYIMDPGLGNAMDPTHANVLAAFINEPSAIQKPNVVWVRNYARGTMELWTTRAVEAGEEVTACYAADYPRKYKTSCTKHPQYLHYLSGTARVPARL